MNFRQLYDKAFSSPTRGNVWASQRALGLLVIVIIVLLLSGSGWRLGWRR